MKHFTLFFLLLAAIGSPAQKAEPAPITRFYLFTGTIDKYPVTLILHRIDDDFAGSYYYKSSGTPLSLAGRLDKKGFLNLGYSANDEKDNETMTGLFRDTSYSGTWQSKGKNLTFNLSRQKNDSQLQFDYIWSHGTKKISDKPAHMSHLEGLSYDASAVWPAAGSKHPSKQVIEQSIREMFGEKNSNEEIGKIMIRKKNIFLGTPKDSIDLYESTDAVNVEYLDTRIICLANNWHNYAGGAHGMYGADYVNIDLANNRKLSLDDVLDTAAAKKAMEKMLEQQFRKNFPFDEGQTIKDVLFVEKIPLTEDFALNGKSIGFNYDPYEIAAYVYGQITLTISYRELQPYLRPGFKKLMGL